MINNKSIIVSMTSWTKRINYVSRSIFMMQKQSLQPDLIILNLSEDEFPNKEKDLPKDLLLLLNSIKKFNIFWVKENTKAFKKVIPTIQRFKGTPCWILSIDDDWLYKPTYIEHMVRYAEKNRNWYLTPGSWGMWPHGYAMIYDPNWFKDEILWKITKEDSEKIVSSDLWIMKNLEKNNIRCLKDKLIETLIVDCKRPDKLSKQYSCINFKERLNNVNSIYDKLNHL